MSTVMPDQLSDQLRSEIYGIVYEAIKDVLYENNFDMEKELQRQALAESGEFVRRNIPLYRSVHALGVDGSRHGRCHR